MSLQVPDWFIDIFVPEVHHAYQRYGARLETMVRQDGTGEGSRVKFPKLGLSKMVQKARHGQVPVADRDENHVWCNIEDWYPEADLVEVLDQLKTNVALRQNYARSQTYAMGRKADDIILQSHANATNETTDVGVITLAKVFEAYTYLGDNSVPEDGDRYFVVSPKGWTDLMAIPQFSSADWVAQNEMPFKGGFNSAKRWQSFFVFTQGGSPIENGSLPKTGNTRTGYAWHRMSIGYHKQDDISITVDWENLLQAWSIVGRIACGSVLIDDRGVYKVRHDETATP